MKTNGPSTHIKLSRRQLLLASGTGLAGLAATLLYQKYKSEANSIQVIQDENSARGHMVREELDLKNIVNSSDTGTVIVGSGVSGLTTAWFLEKHGQKDYSILEADSRIGGNSASDGNDLSQFPLGAHYLPIVRNDDVELVAFLKEIGVITGFERSLPVYNDEYLCQVPNERLYIKGRWQEGIVPLYAADTEQTKEMKTFLAFVDGLRTSKGRDGKYLFSIPVDKSSQDEEWLKLDQISFKDFLHSKGWKSEYLNWYADYCCRDDFGLDADETSAWAGLHYFASRNGLAANAEVQSVLTWPQGNGFLVQQLLKGLSQKVKTESTVRKVLKKENHFEVYFTNAQMQTELVTCKKLVYAIPKTVAGYIQPELKFKTKAQSHPWLVANVELQKDILEEKSHLNWDNVRYGTSSLGYVNSCHQLLSQENDKVNITFYHAFSKGNAKELRILLSKMSEKDKFNLVLNELKEMHPQIERFIDTIKIKVWGHGMVSPKVGYIWNERKQLIADEPKDVIFAHTERAGVSIFEEAFHQGLRAAGLIAGHS